MEYLAKHIRIGFAMILSVFLLLAGSVLIDADETKSNKIPELKFKDSRPLPPNCAVVYEKSTLDKGKMAALQPISIIVEKSCSLNPNECTNFTDTEIIKKSCLFKLYTDLLSNTTYWNKYCALCKEMNVESFTPWDYWLSCKMKEKVPDKDSNFSGYLAENYTESTMKHRLKTAEDDGTKLIFDSGNDSVSECKILRVIPDGVKPFLSNCDYGSRENSDQKTSSQASESPFDYFCNYRNEYGENCTENWFPNPNIHDWHCDENGYFLSNSTLYECTNYTSKNRIYVCGPTERPIYKKIHQYVIHSLNFLSVFLLIVYFVMSTNKQYLRNLSKRIFYSYSLTSLALYANQYFYSCIKLCLIRYCLYFYIWHSHSFWILITSYDLWRIVYNSSKIIKIQIDGQNIRFAVYCILCWGTPALLLVALFPTLNNTLLSWTCPEISGFRNDKLCTNAFELNTFSNILRWITVVIFLFINPCFFILASFLIWRFTRRKSAAKPKPNYFQMVLKIAVMMGIQWILLYYAITFDAAEKLDFILEIITALHGSFLFLISRVENNITWDGFKKFASKRLTWKHRNMYSTQAPKDISLSSTRQNESSLESI